MKERPILFSGPMVCAINDGRKTQTRRVVKLVKSANPHLSNLSIPAIYSHAEVRKFDEHGLDFGVVFRANEGGEVFVPCPYGQPGDRLWVRETWNVGDDKHNFYIEYRADSDGVAHQHDRSKLNPEDEFLLERWSNKTDEWNPSIFMPRWASRITLEITGVRVERLQDIEGQHESESDALKEGVNAIHHGDGDYYYSAFRNEPHGDNWNDPACAFQELWQSINGPDSWTANPWVWVIEFKRVKP